MKDFTALKVGLVSLILIIVLAGLIIWKSGVLFHAKGYELIGEFPSVNGLVEGAEVRFRGIRVGKVFQIIPHPDKVNVHFRILNSVEVPRGSILKVYFDGLIGEKFLNIVPSNSYSDYLKPGETLQGITAPALAEFIDIGAKNLEITREILSAYRDVLNSKEVLEAVKNTALSIESISQDVASLMDTFGGPTTKAAIQSTIQNLQKTSKLLQEKTEGLLNDPRLIASIQALANTTARMDRMTEKLDDEILTSETTTAIQSTLQDVAVIAKEIREVLEGKVPEKDGVLKTVSNLKRLEVRPAAQIYYIVKSPGELGGRAQVDVALENQYIRAGFDALRFQDGPRYHLQHGTWMGNLGARYGLVHSHLGLGVDYKFSENARIGLDLYNITAPEADIRAQARLLKNWDMLFLLKKDPVSNAYDRYGFGLQHEW